MRRCVYVFLIATMFYASSYAGVNYQMSLDNGQMIDSNTFEFNVYIKSMDSTFQLTSYQCSFSFNVDSADGNSLVFSYVPGSSELSNPPSVGIGLKTTDGTQKLTFASIPGSDYISSIPLRVGSFRLQDPNSLGGVNPDVRWNFEGKVTTILTGTNFVNITNPSDHIKSFGDLVNYQVVGVTTTDMNTSPERTIDGLGYYDGNPNANWAVQPMPQYLIFDLGKEKSVSMTKFSFYNFQAGRIYQYTVSVSDDQVNWKDVVVNASSASEEWTVNQFTPQQARYVKLQFLSANNTSWANLWEAQILGTNESSTLGNNLVSTGTFDSDTVWYKGTGWSIANGVASCDGSQTGYSDLSQSLLPNPSYNRTYYISFDLALSAGGVYITPGGYESLGGAKYTSSGSYEGYITVTNTSSNTNLYITADADFVGSIDNVVVKEQLNNKDNITSNTDVEQIDKYSLQQNYPNPFNPNTNIEFELKENSKVKLTVYNILGEEVAELINGEINAGMHKVEFNGANLASGVYVYRFDAGNKFTETKKMVLMK